MSRKRTGQSSEAEEGRLRSGRKLFRRMAISVTLGLSSLVALAGGMLLSMASLSPVELMIKVVEYARRTDEGPVEVTFEDALDYVYNQGEKLRKGPYWFGRAHLPYQEDYVSLDDIKDVALEWHQSRASLTAAEQELLNELWKIIEKERLVRFLSTVPLGSLSRYPTKLQQMRNARDCLLRFMPR